MKTGFAKGIVIALLAAGMVMPVAHADDDDDEGFFSKRNKIRYGGENRGKPLQPANINPKFQQECSECHIAYVPGLMSAESWRRVMAGLDQHFGSDASIDAQENQEITDYLVSNASNRWSAPTAPLRITEAAWFKRMHGSHEIPPRVWKNPKINSPANCAVCHPDAVFGEFDEDGLVLPR